jgi:hypothetical protein
LVYGVRRRNLLQALGILHCKTSTQLIYSKSLPLET